MSKYSDKLVSEVIELKNSGFTVTEITEIKRLTRNQIQYILYQLKRDLKAKEPDKKFDLDAIDREKEPKNLHVLSFLQRLKKCLFG
jgi:orotate phosphoribosyltransferase-like protein